MKAFFLFVLLSLGFGAFAADCTPGQHQYSVGPVYGAGPFTGTTIAAACSQVVPYTGGSYSVGPGALECTFSIDAGGHRAVTELCTTPGGEEEPPPTTPTGTGTFITCSTACTVTVEFSNSKNPFVLSVADGLELSGLIIAVWLIGWGFRQLIKAVNPSDTV